MSHFQKPASSPSGFVRINKALADAGVCSRRKAEELIVQGLVSVNGVPVRDLSCKVDPLRDRLAVNGIPLQGGTPRTCLLMHKPVQIVCTVHDPEGRPTILDILPSEWRSARLYPVGRLDYFSEGLLLLTDDGELAHRLAHPRHHLSKVYTLLVREAVSEKALAIMRGGMTLAEGETLAPVGVHVLPSPTRGPQGTLLRLTLRQGVNRQIRRMCRDLGLTILKLTRIAQGPLELGSLPLGAVRTLTDDEYAKLRTAVGLGP